jgi:hypothetical protein
MADEVLTTRALNRATLDRQLLLRRAKLSAFEVVEHLVGMQAQAPLPPYFGLWTRLHRFRPDDLARLILDRRVVRIVLMRGTVHLVSAADCLALRPLVQPIMDADLRTNTTYSAGIADVDLPSLAAAGRQLLDEKPRTNAELRPLLGAQWPNNDVSSLAFAIRNLLPLVQIPPRGIWGSGGQPTFATAETWLGRPLDSDVSPDDVVVRYLAAFGPATVADVQTWSGLTRLREVLERLRPRLRTFRDESGKELFDLPDASRPDPDAPAAPRFLPPFDNLLLSHADRTRVISDPDRKRLSTSNGVMPGTVLVDGFVCGTWKITRDRAAATLCVDAFRRLSKKDTAALGREGARLLSFAEPDADTHDVQLATAE